MSAHMHTHGAGGHHHGHGHAHHGHAHGHPQSGQVHTRLTYALVLTVIVAAAEVIGGMITNSLALLADAGHMVTDVAALALALFAIWLGRRPAPAGQTFGARRWEILAAWVNGAALVAISGVILWEAVARLSAPPQVDGKLMLIVATVGLLTNGVSAFWLHRVSETSLNARGAYLHVLADLAGSAATIIAAIFLVTLNWWLADPIASIAVSLIVLGSAWRLVKESTDVLLEATPAHIDIKSVRSTLENVESVESVHDLHVWTVGGGMVAMSAHAVLSDAGSAQNVLTESRRAMEEMGIAHVTIQLENPALEDCDCTEPRTAGARSGDTSSQASGLEFQDEARETRAGKA